MTHTRMGAKVFKNGTSGRDDAEAYVFPLEALIREYNSKLIHSPSKGENKQPLSLLPVKPESRLSKTGSTLDAKSYPLTIRAMTEEEVKNMRDKEMRQRDWNLLKDIFQKQLSGPGFMSNIPLIANTVTLTELAKDIGWTGSIYYKSVGEQIYVILKGSPASRNIFKGTRYLNGHPDIVRFGLAKTNVLRTFRAGFKGSILLYCGVKAVEAVTMLLEHGELKTSFFSSIVTDIPKLAITSAVTALATAGVVAAGVPIAIGVGVVLAVGFFTGIALDYIDRKNGITEKVNDTANKMIDDLEQHLKDPATGRRKSNDWDPQKGLLFDNPFVPGGRICHQRNYLSCAMV